MVRMALNVESHSGYAWLLEQMGCVAESELQYAELVRLEPDNAICCSGAAVKKFGL